jgi:hypothetical protein
LSGRHKDRAARPKKAEEVVPRRAPAPEAYEDYDDVTAEAVKSVQERADKVLNKGKWTVVDGHVDDK